MSPAAKLAKRRPRRYAAPASTLTAAMVRHGIVDASHFPSLGRCPLCASRVLDAAIDDMRWVHLTHYYAEDASGRFGFGCSMAPESEVYADVRALADLRMAP